MDWRTIRLHDNVASLFDIIILLMFLLLSYQMIASFGRAQAIRPAELETCQESFMELRNMYDELATVATRNFGQTLLGGAANDENHPTKH